MRFVRFLVIIRRMIKNRRWRWWPGFAVLATLAAACDGAQSQVPSPHQGVVELDQRIASFEIGGRVTSVVVRRGDVVAAGQVIATLDDALLKPQRDARAAELEQARAQLALVQAGARKDDLAAVQAQIRALAATEDTTAKLLARQRELVKQAAAPEATLDELEGKVRATRAQRNALEHQLAALREGARPPELALAEARVQALEAALAGEDVRRTKYTLVAPVAGEVLDVLAEAGEVVGPGTPVLAIGDRDHPYVDAFVAIASLAPLDVGGAAQVLVDGVGPMAATIEHIAPTTEFTPRYVFSKSERPHLVTRVRLRLADPDHRVHPGLPAFVLFPSASAPSAAGTAGATGAPR